MATIKGSTSSSLWDFKLEVTETATSIANNTSSVKVDAYIGRNTVGSYMYGAKIPCTVKCTGVSNKSFTYSNSGRVDIGVGEWLKIGSVTFTGVPHSSDGSKTVTISASFTNNISPSSGSASGSFALTTLPRKSTLSASNGTLGTSQTLTVDRKSSSFTHTITYKCGSATGTIATKTTSTSISWTPPLTLASQNTTGTSVSVTFTITTYTGSTSLGSNTKKISCTIPSSVKPSCSITLEDVTGIEDVYGSPVQRLSQIKVTVIPTLAYESAIASYVITADGLKFTTATATTAALETAGDSIVSATVKDKRGRSGSASYTMDVQAYEFPTITGLSVHRCDLDGVANDEGDYVLVEFSATITALGDKNTATFILRHKKTSEDNWTEQTLADLANVYLVSNKGYVIPADSNSSYDVEIVAQDNHGDDKRSTSVSTAFTLMNWGSDGTSMGIGKVAEKSGTLEVALKQEVHHPIDLVGEYAQAVPVSDDFKLYEDDTKNQPFVYKNAAGMVELVGQVSPAKSLSNLANSTGVHMFTLPEGYRPAVGFAALEQGSSTAVWCIVVNASGKVTASKYRKGDTYEVPATTAWMPFHQVFFAGN